MQSKLCVFLLYYNCMLNISFLSKSISTNTKKPTHKKYVRSEPTNKKCQKILPHAFCKWKHNEPTAMASSRLRRGVKMRTCNINNIAQLRVTTILLVALRLMLATYMDNCVVNHKKLKNRKPFF